MYTPFLQIPEGYDNPLGRPLTIAVRTVRGNLSALPALRAAVTEVDPTLAGDIRPMSSIASESIAQPKVRAILFSVLGMIAFWLGVLGVYGVVSNMTIRDTRSLGIRFALGATRSSILLLVVRRGMVITSLGVAVGLVLSLFLTRLLQTFLFRIHPNSPTVFLEAAGALMIASFFATYIPARRATRIDPVVALRHE